MTEKEKIQSEANAAKAEIEKINKEKTLAERKAKLSLKKSSLRMKLWQESRLQKYRK